MKKVLSVLLVIAMVAALAACGSAASGEKAAESDSAKIEKAGKLIVGITDFAPMDYKEGEEWIGFDADMAKAFAKSLGVEAEFVEIEWDNKVLELEAGTIDCVWNGMTLTPEVTSAMDCSAAYCNNAQIVVVPEKIADDYRDEEAVKTLNYAVESGSAGQQAADDMGASFVEVTNQAAALMEVAAGTADAAIIDALMADAMIGPGTSYEDLTTTLPLTSEEYGVGFRKGSDLVEKLNQFFKDAYADGSMIECAEQYYVLKALIEQK